MNARCAIIDLSALSVEMRTLSGIGWEIHLKWLKDLWRQNHGMVALSTGALSGTGAPGSGGFCWCCWSRNRFHVVPAEGRFGAACRYGGIDHLLLKGAAEHPSELIIRNGEFTFSAASAKQYGAAQQYRGIWRRIDGDACVMTVGAREILEDGVFRVGDSSLARKLKKVNLRSISVMAAGGIPIHSPELFLAVCQEIYRARRGMRRDGAQNTFSRYLSLRNATDDGRAFPPLAMDGAGVRPALESMLGLCWGNDFPLDNPLSYAARLMNAYTGKPFSARSLEKSAIEAVDAARSARCGKEEGGAYGQ
ncbi:MAG: hypothetical protein FWF87_07735 [Synergistaceae bacterium]|nr:hypothetical protein [Synergistaceae bacterium]